MRMKSLSGKRFVIFGERTSLCNQKLLQHSTIGITKEGNAMCTTYGVHNALHSPHMEGAQEYFIVCGPFPCEEECYVYTIPYKKYLAHVEDADNSHIKQRGSF